MVAREPSLAIERLDRVLVGAREITAEHPVHRPAEAEYRDLYGGRSSVGWAAVAAELSPKPRKFKVAILYHNRYI
jgi:hypothetical protein